MKTAQQAELFGIIFAKPGAGSETAGHKPPFGTHYPLLTTPIKCPSKTHEHWLRREPNAPEFFHPLLNMVFQRQNVRGGCFSAVHDGQGVFARDSDLAAAVARLKPECSTSQAAETFFCESSAG